MSDSTLLEKLMQEQEKLSDKMDKALSVLGDIKANEKLTEHRFIESDRRHEELRTELKEFKDHVEKDYTTKAEVSLVKKIVYTACALILCSVLTATVTLVVKSPPSTVISKTENS